MNKRTRGQLVGMVFGDGWIGLRNGGTSAALGMMHAARQLPLLKYKKDFVDEIFPGRSDIRAIDNNGYPGVVFERGSKKLLLWRHRFYPGGTKTITRQLLDWLTTEGFAIWWMDDGSLYMKRKNGKVHAREGILSTYCPLDEARVVTGWLADTYGIIASPQKHKGKYRIRFNTTALRLLCPLLAPHVIPEMKYKVDMQYQTIAPGTPTGW